MLSSDEQPPRDGSAKNLAHMSSNDTASKGRNNLMEVTIGNWLRSIPTSTTAPTVDERCRVTSKAYRSKLGYTVYPPLLLLPLTALSDYFRDDYISSHLPRLYDNLSEAFKVTHIALNAPIPASSSDASISISNPEDRKLATPNVLRSPTGMTPLLGDFGPVLHAGHVPISSDFESAFWCTAKQNAIFQTWAPRYTMFSRGNISEKVRIYGLASSRIQDGPANTLSSYVAEKSTAIDLYAGIGYFAFSYAKAGAANVVCWEINPWSVEGLRRGARMNRWPTKVFRECEDDNVVLRGVIEERPRIIMFEESNECAEARIRTIRDHLPPIRHVNCGYLPSSKASWKTAVAALDPRSGGWIHAHENVAKKDIEHRKCEIVDIFTDLVKEVYSSGNIVHRLVSCENVERVKSYAPGVIHCVFDIAVNSFPDA